MACPASKERGLVVEVTGRRADNFVIAVDLRIKGRDVQDVVLTPSLGHDDQLIMVLINGLGDLTRNRGRFPGTQMQRNKRQS